MMLWVVLTVTGICTFISLYMAFLGLRVGDNGAFLFMAFGLIFCIPFVATLMNAVSKRKVFFKRVSEQIYGEKIPVSFVPHHFVMTAIIVAGIGILAAVIVPIIFK